jgi:hypothetical protein
MTSILNDIPEGAVTVTEWDGRSWFALATVLTAIAYMIYLRRSENKEN